MQVCLAAAASHPVRLLSYECCCQPLRAANLYRHVCTDDVLCYAAAVLKDILCHNDGRTIEFVPLPHAVLSTFVMHTGGTVVVLLALGW